MDRYEEQGELLDEPLYEEEATMGNVKLLSKIIGLRLG
jgi:hypothetical protein